MDVVDMGSYGYWDRKSSLKLIINHLTEALKMDDGVTGRRIDRTWSNPSEIPPNICRFYIQGFCKHGLRCRFLHKDSYTMLNPIAFDAAEHHHSRTLEELEAEIIELLKSRRPNPVSIASLPSLYYDKFKKTLQAEGYLTESQRQGKIGFSLTKLLARLKNSIRLIERPNGQHSVILAEDAPRYLEFLAEKEDTGTSGLRRIYLTFPPDSTFSEKDVFDYFENFGPVEDVRIPCQEKRMFGFVTFVYPDTVLQILSKHSPHHFVNGARILAKRYRERKTCSKFQTQMDRHQFLRLCEMMRMRKITEFQRSFELERMRTQEIQFAYFQFQTHLAQREQSVYSSDDILNQMLDVTNNTIQEDTNFDSDRRFNLLESLF